MTKRQLEETAKYCFDISKLFLGSWVFGLLSQTNIFVIVLYMFFGLFGALLFYKIGLRLFEEADSNASR
jgi:hypothetical protein